MKFEVPALVELGQQASLVGIELTMFRRRVVHSRENAVFLKSLDVVPKRRHTAYHPLDFKNLSLGEICATSRIACTPMNALTSGPARASSDSNGTMTLRP